MSHLVEALWDELWFVNMGYTNKIWLIDWLTHHPKDNNCFLFVLIPLGIMEGDCLVGCEVQKEPQKWGHVGVPGQSHCTDWRPKLSQEARETTHQGEDGQSGGGVMREDKNGGIKADTVPGQLVNTESSCRYTALPDLTELEVRLNFFSGCMFIQHICFSGFFSVKV